MAVSKVMNSAELTELCDLYCFWCGTERDIRRYLPRLLLRVYTSTSVGLINSNLFYPLTTIIPVGTAKSSLLSKCAGQYHSVLLLPKCTKPPLPRLRTAPGNASSITTNTHRKPKMILVMQAGTLLRRAILKAFVVCAPALQVT